MKNWLRGPLRPMMDDLLAGVEERGWFDAAVIRRLETEHLQGRENHAHRLWCLMSLELSLRGLERNSA
jgi:asparagine synthase (glutamine-hydrolysing)